MKRIKYILLYMLPFVSLMVPMAVLAYASLKGDYSGLPLAAAFGVCGAVLSVMTKGARARVRQEVETDEFGNSKKKGKYENLTRAEREAIDLQKTADAERILNTSAIKKMSKEGSRDPEGDMAALVGLVETKEKMAEMAARMKFDSEGKKKRKKGNTVEGATSGRHMVFTGAPGTGKTTVARIMAGFLYKYGYIRENKCIEVDGNFLKAGIDTATKTELVIRQAYGGVLFIDEAYALMDGGTGEGEAAVATLIKQMEDARGRFILIMAGYSDEMDRLLRSNPGFASRVKEYVDFPSYGVGDMREIFRNMAKKAGFDVAEDTWKSYDIRIEKERTLRTFANARTARNVLDEAIDRHALNYSRGAYDKGDRNVLHMQDIPKEPKRVLGA